MSKVKNPPAFQFYPESWLGDPDVQMMSLAEKGAYITLICSIWVRDGFPNEEDKVRRLLGSPKNFKTLWNNIKHKFVVVDETIHHRRLIKERDKIEDYKNKRSKAGKIGAKARWQSHTIAKEVPLANDGFISINSINTSKDNNNIDIKEKRDSKALVDFLDLDTLVSKNKKPDDKVTYQIYETIHQKFGLPLSAYESYARFINRCRQRFDDNTMIRAIEDFVKDKHQKVAKPKSLQNFFQFDIDKYVTERVSGKMKPKSDDIVPTYCIDEDCEMDGKPIETMRKDASSSRCETCNGSRYTESVYKQEVESDRPYREKMRLKHEHQD